MGADEHERLDAAVKALPIGAFLTDLHTRAFLVVNDRAADLVGVPAQQLLGRDAISLIHRDEQSAAVRAYDALASRAIDGYQVRRRIVMPDSSERVLFVTGRRVDGPGGPYGLWIVTSDVQAQTFDATDVPPPDFVLALTDHDWQLQYVNIDADLLGIPGETLESRPLLGFVHPSVATEFLEAASRAVAEQMAVTFETRLRAAQGWAARYVLLVPMCHHTPPRLGVVITDTPLGGADADRGLEPHMRHSAVEARARQALRALPRLAEMPGAVGLSVRQVEIVSRLIDGEHVDQIAKSLYLSASTVRNHLTAIYRKFGVHSQAELLAALLRASQDDH